MCLKYVVLLVYIPSSIKVQLKTRFPSLFLHTSSTTTSIPTNFKRQKSHQSECLLIPLLSAGLTLNGISHKQALIFLRFHSVNMQQAGCNHTAHTCPPIVLLSGFSFKSFHANEGTPKEERHLFIIRADSVQKVAVQVVSICSTSAVHT